MATDGPFILMIATASVLLLAGGVVLGCVGFSFYHRLLAPRSQAVSGIDSKTSLTPPPMVELTGCGAQAAVSLPHDQPYRPDRLVYGNYDNPAIEICRYEARGRHGAVLPLNREAKVNLSALMSHAPVLALDAAVMSSNVYRLVLNPEVAQGLMNGTLEHLRASDGGIYAVVRDSAGKEFAAQGSLHRVSGVNPATVGFAIWQIMAVVTQQKYLADINHHLSAIKRGVAAIKDWLEGDRNGTIIGNLNYLQHVAAMLQRHQLTEVDSLTYNQQIEEIERECGQIMAAIAPRLDIPAEEFRNMKLGGAGLEKHFEAAKECIVQYGSLLQPYLVALYVRAVAAQVKCALPVNRRVVQSRLEELRDRLGEQEERQVEFQELFQRRLPQLQGLLTRDHHNRETQERLQTWLDRVIQPLDETLEQMAGMVSCSIATVALQMEEAQDPVVLAVTLDDSGMVQAVSRVSSDG